MIKFFGKSIVAVICLSGIFGYGHIIVGETRQLFQNFTPLIAFGVGCLIYVAFWIFLFSRDEGIWSTMEHEVTHALFALLFFKKVHSLSAKREVGGEVKLSGGNFVISLAPYFFPLFTVVIILIKPFIIPTYQWVFNGLIGFTLMFHLNHLFREFHPSQPDINRTGIIFSFIVVTFFNLFFLGLVIVALNGSWLDMRSYVAEGATQSIVYLREGWMLFRENVLYRYIIPHFTGTF